MSAVRPSVQEALLLAGIADITAILSEGLPALADWTWWATAAMAGICGAVMGGQQQRRKGGNLR